MNYFLFRSLRVIFCLDLRKHFCFHLCKILLLIFKHYFETEFSTTEWVMFQEEFFSWLKTWKYFFTKIYRFGKVIRTVLCCVLAACSCFSFKNHSRYFMWSTNRPRWAYSTCWSLFLLYWVHAKRSRFEIHFGLLWFHFGIFG